MTDWSLIRLSVAIKCDQAESRDLLPVVIWASVATADVGFDRVSV